MVPATTFSIQLKIHNKNLWKIYSISLGNILKHDGLQGCHSRQDRQDWGLVWSLQQLRSGDVAATVAILLAKKLPWRPWAYVELMHEISFSTYLSCIENVSLNMPSVNKYVHIHSMKD